MRACFNPKVLIALAAVAAMVYVVAPDLAVAAVPLLILALCPLMMWVMMRMMMRGGQAPAAVTDASAAAPTASRGASDGGQRPDVGERDEPGGQTGGMSANEAATLRARLVELERRSEVDAERRAADGSDHDEGSARRP